jgi:protein-L-isoaspartate(D-aspartate) O-methyltransferase
VIIGCVVFLAVLPSASAMDNKERRMNMVDKYIAGEGIRDPATLDAMRAVPREKFVPDSLRRSAYDNRPLPIGFGQTISQPYVVGFMTEALQLKPSDCVLEIGTGSGYQAAILAEIVDEVYTIEIVEPLGTSAAALFAQLGHTNIHAKVGDGYYGWPDKAPFDAIIVTAAASHIPPPLIEQLKPGGRMIIPVGSIMMVQHLLLVEKDGDGHVTNRSLLPVRFVPLTGGPGS